MDMCLILAASATEPSLLSTIGSWVFPALGVALGLTFVIFVHELGHFLVAKACGVKCEKFYVGFDFFEIGIPFTKLKLPRSLLKFQWGETEYGIGSLPLGGYVKMLGQDDDPRNAEHEAARIRAAAPGAPDARVEEIATGKAAEGLVAGQSVEKLTNESLAAAHTHDAVKPTEPPVPATTTAGKTILLDPRSLPAKSVYARAAIFSAGVIMNLIFAVIMASVAYSLGVREKPAVIGSASPGSPAWTAGIRPGSKIVQFGKRGTRYDHLRFDDLMTAVMLNGYDGDVEMRIIGADGSDEWYAIRPSQRLKAEVKRPTIGIAPINSRKVLISEEGDNPKAAPELVDKDVVVKAEGQRLENDADLQAIMAQKPFGPLAITVERRPAKQTAEEAAKTPPQTIDVTLPAKPMREIGAVMKMGRVTAVRKGSPAEAARFLPGDQIVEVNGEPVGDPLSLGQRLVAQAMKHEPITFVVTRDNSKMQHTLTVQPELPRQFDTEYMTGGPAGIECVGLAFDVLPTVESVAPGSPADKAGIQAGDTITQFQLIPANDAQRKREKQRLKKEWLEPTKLTGEVKTWTWLFTLMQATLPDTEIQLTWQRGSETKSAKLKPVESTTFFDESRGLNLYGQTEIHLAKSPGEALQLGFRETKERVKEVGLIIQSLVTRRLSATNLSGPAGIIYAAGSFASEGPAMLLIFLTILSANLAVLNFLPIPALDGGHMLFLAAEWVRGKPVDERLQIRLTIAGVLCLLTLMVFATAMDINRFAQLINSWF